ncbi:MAG: hypothetical protein HZA46_06300 [Planctomycetales bacterium]|nr:hypothetical protein [Planctomycetales bacterium]
MRTLIPLLMLFLALVLTGCNKEEKLRTWQQQQVEQLQQQAHENSETARELVKADAQARQEVAVLHRDLQSERIEVGHQRDALESDRKDVATARERVPLLATAFQGGAVLLTCALCLGVCGWLLSGVSKPDSDGELEDLLVLEVGGEPTPLSPSLPLVDNSPTIMPAIEQRFPGHNTSPHLAA